MNLPLIKAALRASERFVKAELAVREASYLPEPDADGQAIIREADEALMIVQRAIVDLEVGA